MATQRFAAYRSGMTKWGQKVDRGSTDRPGWRDDPDRPGIERYWSGQGWDNTIAPRPKPEPALKQVRIVVLAILIAAAILFTAWRMTQPSDLECSTQKLQVLTGKRLAVESACVGR